MASMNPAGASSLGPPEINAPWARCLCTKPFIFEGFISVDGSKAIHVTNDNPEGTTKKFPYYFYGGPITDANRSAFDTAMQKLTAFAKCLNQDVDEEAAVNALIRETIIDAILVKEMRGKIASRLVLLLEGKLVPLTTKTFEYQGPRAEELRKEIGEKWPGAIILNDLPEAKALCLYKAAKRAQKAVTAQQQ